MTREHAQAMTLPHTLQYLLPLLDTPEGLEKLRIITAEADGWIPAESYLPSQFWVHKSVTDFSELDLTYIEGLPNYPHSLDAIFAAEERLGLHEYCTPLADKWISHAEDVQYERSSGVLLAFMTPAYRCIPFILTAQEVRPS